MRKSILTVILTGFLTCQAFSQVSTKTLTNGLIAYYPLNGNANDYSGNNKNGTLINGVSFENYFNGLSSARFDGTNQYISIPYKLVSLGDYSYTCWFKCDSTNPASILNQGGYRFWGYDFGLQINLWTSEGANTNSIAAYMYYQGLGYTGKLNNSNYAQSTSSLSNIGTWHFASVTYSNNSLLRIYIDNMPVASNALSWNSQSIIGDNFYIGGVPQSSIPGWLKGNVTNVRLYKRALSSNEISAIYSLEAPITNTVLYTLSGTSTTTTSNAVLKITGTGYALSDDTGFGGYIVKYQQNGTNYFTINYSTNVDVHTAGTGLGAVKLYSLAMTDGAFPNVEKEVVWASGTNALIGLSKTKSIVAPKTLSAFDNVLTLQGGTVIQNQSGTLTIDTTNTYTAYTNNETAWQTLIRLSNSFSRQGLIYQP